MSKGQEGQVTQEQEKEFIGQFSRISSEEILRAYEAKNREKIQGASWEVKGAFDKVWQKVTGNSYFQPSTVVKMVVPTYGQNNTEASDPKSRKYLAQVTFSKIIWRKIRRRIRKKPVVLYTLEGVVADTGKKRPIFQNLDVNRLRQVVNNDKVADQILTESKKNDYGEVSGSFDIMVEGYWEVMFSPKRAENDTMDVRITWEGQCLRMQRMVPVVLPGFYVEAADNAVRAQYIQTPEESRKIVGWIQEYPYTVRREASMEEYLVMKTQGNKIMTEAVRREMSKV